MHRRKTDYKIDTDVFFDISYINYDYYAEREKRALT